MSNYQKFKQVSVEIWEKVKSFLSHPFWGGISGVVAVVALIFAIYTSLPQTSVDVQKISDEFKITHFNGRSVADSDKKWKGCFINSVRGIEPEESTNLYLIVKGDHGFLVDEYPTRGDGEWSGSVTLGEKNKGKGREFTVFAVLTSKQRPAGELKKYPPEDAIKSNKLTVIRNRDGDCSDD